CLSSALLIAGCDNSDSNSGSSSNAKNSTPKTTSPAAPPSDTTRPDREIKPTTPPQPDNTGVNKRDRDTDKPANKTPMDQANNNADIAITEKIRSTIMADKAMSTDAQNCKIITDKGVVTLRGVVDSATEKMAIENIAKATAGVTRVDNQLEVKPKADQ